MGRSYTPRGVTATAEVCGLGKTVRSTLGAVAVALISALALVSCEAEADRFLDGVLGASSGAASGPSTIKGAPAPPGELVARRQLGALEVARVGSMAGYSREEFPHWASDAEAYG